MKLAEMVGRNTIVALLLALGHVVEALPLSYEEPDSLHWITAWTAMPQLTEPANLPSGIFVGGDTRK